MAMNPLLPLGTLCALLLPALSPCQEAPVLTPRPATGQEAGEVVPLRLRTEIWEAPALEITKRLDEVQDGNSLTKLRSAFLAGVPEVSLVFSSVVSLDGAGKTTVESITERIYPTEYSPPSCFSLPSQDEPKNWKEAVVKALNGESMPSSFETRNTGLTQEVEAEKAKNAEKAWDVALAIDDVRMVGTETFGPNLLKFTMPSFTSFRDTHRVRLKEGQWRLLSVLEPPRGMEGKPSSRRWITLVRIDREE